MNKEHLIKDGKFYNPETAELIAYSNWNVWYEYKREKIYKSAKGVFFSVKEIANSDGNECRIYLKNGDKTYYGAVQNTYRDDIDLKAVHIQHELTIEQVRDKYEYTAKGNAYSIHNDGRYSKLLFLKTYDELFEIEEA